ncbi:MAG: DUF6064 family protein [Rhodospirillaceae bacterium]|nr:DUF6064 family protein [Rhodospirillaceae bacterium]
MSPYDADALFAFLEQYNRALWPAQILALLLALGALALAPHPRAGSGRLVGGILSAAWLSSGILYYLLHLSEIDFVAPLFGLLLIAQGLLLAWDGAIRGRLSFAFRSDSSRWAGLALAFAALMYEPLIAMLGGQDWLAVRVVGLAPAPTLVFTLGLLLLAERVAIYLLVIPILWAIGALALAWFLGIPADLVLPLAGIAAGLLILWRRTGRVRL